MNYIDCHIFLFFSQPMKRVRFLSSIVNSLYIVDNCNCILMYKHVHNVLRNIYTLLYLFIANLGFHEFEKKIKNKKKTNNNFKFDCIQPNLLLTVYNIYMSLL